MKSVDYIIVGAGTAGCVLANRLSQNPDNTVMLLEAGKRDVHPNIHIPGAYAKNHKSGHDWGFIQKNKSTSIIEKFICQEVK